MIFILNPKSKTWCQNGPSTSFYIYNIQYLVIFLARLPTVPFSPQLELHVSLSNTLKTERIQGFEQIGWVIQWPIFACSWRINCFEWISSMNASVIKQWFATTNSGYTLKDFLNLIRSSKCKRPHTRGQQNPRFNRFAHIVCGVPRAMWWKKHTTHQQIFNLSPDCEHGKSRRISRDLRIN